MAKKFIASISTDDQRAPSVTRQGTNEIRTYILAFNGDKYEIESYLHQMNNGTNVAAVRVKLGDRIIHDWNSRP